MSLLSNVSLVDIYLIGIWLPIFRYVIGCSNYDSQNQTFTSCTVVMNLGIIKARQAKTHDSASLDKSLTNTN